MKNFIVIGLGNFGLNVSKTLQESGCEVLGIDIEKDTVQNARDYVSHAIVCDSTNKSALNSLGLKDFDGAIVSIGQNMASSILISLYLKELGIEKIIVRAVSEDHEKILKLLGVHDVVFPERDMAIRIGKLLSMKNALDYLPLTDEYAILEVNPPASFVNKSLKELGISAKYNCQVLGIKFVKNAAALPHDESNIQSIKMVSSANDIITENSIMIILGKPTDIQKMQRGR